MNKLLLTLSSILLLSGCGQLNKEVHYFTVDSKERKCDSDGSSVDCYYIVYGTKGEVFTNKDDLFNAKFDSASIQARMKVGSKYKVSTTGWRIPMLSAAPNIYKVEDVE